MYREFLKHTFGTRKLYTVLTLLLWLIASISLYLVVNSTFNVIEGYHRLDTLKSHQIYMGNNQMTDAQEKYLDTHPEIADKKAQVLCKYLRDNFEYSMQWENEIKYNSKAATLLTLSPNVFKYYRLKVRAGRVFDAKDFNSNKKTIPVLIGYSFSRHLSIGQNFKQYNPANGKHEKYKVVGILAKNANLQSVYMLDSAEYLNNCIVRPMNKFDLSQISANEFASGCQDLILTNCSKRKVQLFQHKLAADNFMNIKFYTPSSNMQLFFEDYLTTLKYYALFIAVILLASLVFASWNLIQFYKDFADEIYLRMACGMTKGQITYGFMLYQAKVAAISSILFVVYIYLSYHPALTEGFLNIVYDKVFTIKLLYQEVGKWAIVTVVMLILSCISCLPIKHKLNQLGEKDG